MSKKPRLSFEDAKAQYVHRFTTEHVPAWSQVQCSNGRYYAPQYCSDREWYNNTEFPPHNGRRKYCTSLNQSWPLGKWLDEPYAKGGAI